MMMKSKLSIFLLCLVGLFSGLLLALSSCSNELEIPSSAPVIDGDDITISGSIAIPDMNVVATRGGFGTIANAGLKLTVLEFDLAATNAQSFITNVYQAEFAESTTTGVDNLVEVPFKVTLKAAATSKVLHFMLTDDFVSVPEDGGSVASLLPALSVGSKPEHTEAYWGYVEFPDGFTTMGEDKQPVLRDDVEEKLTKIPVIRNFAQITVTENLDNFELIGFDVVNCPTTGTIAPWNATKQEIPSLLDKTETGVTMKSYTGISVLQNSDTSDSSEEDISGLPYSGILPESVGFYNQEADARNWDTEGDSHDFKTPGQSVFMYEHPYERTRRTYLIVKGNYSTDGTNWTTGYYKLDIGKLKEDGSFEYYNIIRNIHYNIVINSVSAPGSTSVEDAIGRAPFNNLLASTETSSMLNISNGTNMLIVNDMNHVIVTDGAEVKILYRYLTNVNGTNPGVDNETPEYIVGEGDVIKKKLDGNWDITEGEYTDPSSAKWVELTLQINNPDEFKTLEQTVTIVDGDGLGRTISLILHKPWAYQLIGAKEYTATVLPGQSNLYDENIIPSTDPPQVSNATGEAFTVYFNLPDGLPDSIFPLDFLVEAKYQGIENNKVGTLLVTSGTSLFDPNVTAIQYIKTVSLEEYKYQYNGENDSSGFNVEKANTDHTIRCRFTTISSVDNGSDGVIRIYNDYFVNPKYTTEDDSSSDPKKSQCAEIAFKRVTNPGNN